MSVAYLLRKESGGYAFFLFEQPAEIMQIIVTDHRTNFRNGIQAEFEKFFCLIEADVDQIFFRGFIYDRFEKFAEIVRRKSVLFCKFRDVDIFPKMICGIIDKIGYDLISVRAVAVGNKFSKYGLDQQ